VFGYQILFWSQNLAAGGTNFAPGDAASFAEAVSITVSSADTAFSVSVVAPVALATMDLTGAVYDQLNLVLISQDAGSEQESWVTSGGNSFLVAYDPYSAFVEAATVTGLATATDTSPLVSDTSTGPFLASGDTLALAEDTSVSQVQQVQEAPAFQEAWTQTVTLVLSDVLGSQDQALAAQELTISDTGLAADTGSLTLQVADASSLLDGPQLAALLSSPDTATGSEMSLPSQVQQGGPDVASLSDVPLTSAVLSLADTGTASALATVPDRALTDTASGTSSWDMQAGLAIVDTGTVVDSLQLLASFQDQDAGTLVAATLHPEFTQDSARCLTEVLFIAQGASDTCSLEEQATAGVLPLSQDVARVSALSLLEATQVAGEAVFLQELAVPLPFVQDLGTLTDQPFPAANLVLSDAANLTSLASLTGTQVVADTGLFQEQATLSTQLLILEVLTLVEDTARTAAPTVGVDLPALQDTAVLTASLAALDFGALTEVTSNPAFLTVFETCLGTDNGTPDVALAVLDAGLLTEALVLEVLLTATSAAQVQEVLTQTSTVLVADSLVFNDLGALVALAILETGSESDQVFSLDVLVSELATTTASWDDQDTLLATDTFLVYDRASVRPLTPVLVVSGATQMPALAASSSVPGGVLASSSLPGGIPGSASLLTPLRGGK
jgi:hypothetical protein